MSRSDLIRQRARSQPRSASEDVAAILLKQPNSKRNDVPAPDAANFDIRVRETLMVYLGRQGDPYDRGITLRDLVESGIITVLPGYELKPGTDPIPIDPGGGTGGTKPDLTPPPVPGDFTATPSLTNIFFSTSPPKFVSGHGQQATNIYGAQQASPTDPLPTFDDAVVIHSFMGDVGSWATTPNTTWFVWAKWLSRDGVESPTPAGGTNGIKVTTGQDVDMLVAAMTGPGEPFKVVAFETTLPDGTVVPPGTYTADAYIHNGFISNAMIKNLAVDDAKIATLSVTKLRSGSMTVGNYAESANFVTGVQGWRFDASGLIEAQTAVIRGTIYADNGYFKGQITATTGNIGGNTITEDAVQSAGYLAGLVGWRLQSDGVGFVHTGLNGGGFTGYAWPAAGQTGFHLSSSGLLIGNANSGRYFQVLNGDVYAPQFSIVGGVATFGGALSAASGTFSGNLSAAGGSFSGTLTAQVVETANIVGAAVTSTYSMAAPDTPSVVVEMLAGDRSLTIIADGGYSESGDGDVGITYAPNDTYVSINGTFVAGGKACIVHAIQDPVPGSYTITLSRSGHANSIPSNNATLVVMRTRR